MAKTIGMDDFLAVDIRVGTIVDVLDFPEARKPAWKLKIDLGSEIGIQGSSAQITELYPREALLNRQVACVVNLPPRKIGPFTSDVLTLGFPDQLGRVVLVAPERKIPNGGRLF